MVRPVAFGFNPETAEPHWFNPDISEFSRGEIARRARMEFDLFVDRLRKASVQVFVMDDTEEPVTPNAVFLNNWVSFHDDGSVVLYPMYAPNRRPERRKGILDELQSNGFVVSRIVDLTHHEKEGRYLEGTGSIVFDHTHQIAYANLSPRTHPEVLKELCATINYRPITFKATVEAGKDILHTDIMMSIGDRFAIACLDAISNETERRTVSSSLRETGHELITIDQRHRAQFAGHVFQVQTKDERSVIAMSTSALHASRPDQRAAIQKYGRIVESPLSLIEGIERGSARSMMAGIHLPRSTASPKERGT
jgi:hypothetical protein